MKKAFLTLFFLIFVLYEVESFLQIETWCDGDKMTLYCYNARINIKEAKYGRWVYGNKCGSDSNINCSLNGVKDIILNSCQHQTTCTLEVSPYTFSDPCPGTKKYLEVAYECVSTLHDY